VTPGWPTVAVVYAVFALAASALAFGGGSGAERPGERDSARRKYPTYVALNLVVLATLWLSASWPLFPLLLLAVGTVVEIELVTTLRRLPASRRGWTLVLAAGVYVPLALLVLLALWRADPSGLRVAFLYLTVAAHDAFAQLAGERWGRRALAPTLSPRKTIEGAAVGIAAAGAMGAALSGALGWPIWLGGALGLVCGVAALGGDLVASSWKRSAGLRDFGTLLGPQGGVLDRVDGLLLAALVMAVLIGSA
jgi:phosphatidate cytidylyltransferase